MSQIGEYLAQGRAGKVYDPEQGLYMDPKTGQAFVPTFTNIQSSNIQGEVEKRMGGPQAVQADPYLIGGGPGNQQGGAMPGRGDQPQAPDINDPWAMANEHMKSKGFKSEIYKEMFGRDPQSGFRNEAERDRFFKGLQSTRNVLVDRFKYQITGKRKQEEARLKNARKQMSQKEAMEMQQSFIGDAISQRDADSMSFDERHGGKTAKEVGNQNFLDALKDYEDVFGGSERGGMPGREAEKAEAGAIDMDEYTPEAYDPDEGMDLSPREVMNQPGGKDKLSNAHMNLVHEWENLPEPKEERDAWIRAKMSGKLPAHYYEAGTSDSGVKASGVKMEKSKTFEERLGGGKLKRPDKTSTFSRLMATPTMG